MVQNFEQVRSDETRESNTRGPQPGTAVDDALHDERRIEIADAGGERLGHIAPDRRGARSPWRAGCEYTKRHDH